MSLLLFIGEEGSVTSIPDEEIHQLYRVVNKFALVSQCTVAVMIW